MTSTNVDNIKFPLPLSKNGFLYGFAESALCEIAVMHFF